MFCPRCLQDVHGIDCAKPLKNCNISLKSETRVFSFSSNIPSPIQLKGQSNEIFCLLFFRTGLFPSLLLNILRLFEFVFEFEEIFAISDLRFAIIYAESPYSLYRYCLIWRVVTPLVVYIRELKMNKLCTEALCCCLKRRVKTPVLFNTENQYFPHRL
jgi:hypothetical protein